MSISLNITEATGTGISKARVLFLCLDRGSGLERAAIQAVIVVGAVCIN